jgi:hypothetical protein
MAIRLLIFEICAWVIIAEAFFLHGTHDASRIHDLAEVATSVSGILFGFLLTAIAMLTAMPENRLMQNMKKTGHLQSLVSETVTGCALHFATLSISLVAAVSEGLASRILLTLGLATLGAAIIRTGSAGRKLKLVASALYAAKQ